MSSSLIKLKTVRVQDTALLWILTGKKHLKIKLQRLRKIWIWTFGSLVVLKGSKTGTNFPKNKVVTGQTPLLVIGPFCSCHSICLNIGLWQISVEWKLYVFNLSGFNQKTVLQFFKKGFRFPKKIVSKLKYWKRPKLSLIVTWKHVDLSNGGLFWKSLVPFFRRNLCSFCWL